MGKSERPCLTFISTAGDALVEDVTPDSTRVSWRSFLNPRTLILSRRHQMAALARGCSRFLLGPGPSPGPRCLKPSVSFTYYTCHVPSRPARRLFSSSRLLAAARKIRASSPPKLSSSIAPTPGAAAAAPATYLSYASTLALKASPTILYQAPSHTGYILGCYGASAFCLVYAGWNFHANYLHPPEGLAPWIPIAFGGVCFLVAVFGGWLMLGPARLVNTITAMPMPVPSASRAASNARPELRIDVQLRKMFPLPFFPARVISTRPEALSLNERLYAPSQERAPTPADRERLRQEQQRLHEIEKTKIMSAPFRHASILFFNAFQSAKRVWTRAGFLELGVKGQVYKLDVSGGWALDEGRALDRLVQRKIM